jgi:hypothetical protein
LDKKTKIYLGLFALLVIAIVYMESVKPKPINWFPSYVSKHKIPYGTYVLHNELDDLFSTAKINKVKIPPYVFLQDSTKQGTYVFIDDAINFGEDEFNKLLQFVKRGNDVFISTHGVQIDTLGLETEHLSSTALDEIPFFKLINKNLSTNISYHRGHREHRGFARDSPTY